MCSLNTCLGHQFYRYPPYAPPPRILTSRMPRLTDSLLSLIRVTDTHLSLYRLPGLYHNQTQDMPPMPALKVGSPVPLGQSCSPPRAPSGGPRPAASPPQSVQPRRQMPKGRDVLISSRKARSIEIKAPTQAFSEEQEV